MNYTEQGVTVPKTCVQICRLVAVIAVDLQCGCIDLVGRGCGVGQCGRGKRWWWRRWWRWMRPDPWWAEGVRGVGVYCIVVVGASGSGGGGRKLQGRNIIITTANTTDHLTGWGWGALVFLGGAYDLYGMSGGGRGDQIWPMRAYILFNLLVNNFQHFTTTNKMHYPLTRISIYLALHWAKKKYCNNNNTYIHITVPTSTHGLVINRLS